MCHNCDDKELKSIASVVNHVWDKHGIEVARTWEQIAKAEDSRMLMKKTGKKRMSGFQCRECNIFLKKLRPFLSHLDKKHGIHIWYERGVSKRHIFLDGILKDAVAIEKSERTHTNDDVSPNRKIRDARENWVPLSKRRFEPRKGEDRD